MSFPVSVTPAARRLQRRLRLGARKAQSHGSGPFLAQPECVDGDASVHAVVEKLREENRVLRQKVTHVSV